MTQDNRNLLESLNEASKSFNEIIKEIENEQEAYWNSLTKEQQLDAFCAVARRIYQAEIVDQGTYRHALYSVFGFGPEAYLPAQCAGYLSIHNSIYPDDHDRKLLEEFCKKYGIEDQNKKIDEFIFNKIL